MSKFLLDSDVIIWHLRGRPEVTGMLRELQSFGVPFCSALSILEVQAGVKKGEEAKTDLFLGALKVFDVTRQIAGKAGALIREQRAKGVTLDVPDAVIAATCQLYELILVTYNTKHYPTEALTFHPLPPLV